MPQKPGAFYRPKELEEALQMLQKPDVVPLAGGTQLLASESGVDVAAVVDLQDVGLDTLESGEDTWLEIGAMVRLARLAAHLEGADGPGPLLANAIQRAGANTYRNAATLGGIVASRLPDSELLAALLVLDATVHLRQPADASMSLRDYLDAPERPPGLITSISLPSGDGHGASKRVARTPADYPIVSVSAWQPAGAAVRLAATGIGPRPQRLPEAEAQVARQLDSSAIEAAAAAAQVANSHPGDFRGDAAYRGEMAAVLTRRVLQDLA